MNTEFIPFPDKKYEIIYADPPWKYADKACAGKRGACFKYLVHSLDWLCSLPVNEIAAENSVLFMWVTMPQLNTCWDVMSSWGFKYKTCAFTWVKLNKKKPSWFWGGGHWTRSNPELCLLGVKGKPKRVSASVHSVIDTPIREHSRKPDKVRERIVDLMGDLPRIELFARGTYPGWDVWGDEAND